MIAIVISATRAATANSADRSPTPKKNVTVARTPANSALPRLPAISTAICFGETLRHSPGAGSSRSAMALFSRRAGRGLGLRVVLGREAAPVLDDQAGRD